MTEDPVDTYRKALKARADAAKRLSAFSDMLRAVGEALRGSWPMHHAGPVKVTIDVTSWPTSQQILDTVDAWNRAHTDATAAWDHIPDDDRVGLKPPHQP